jgi:hypothetical protein
MRRTDWLIVGVVLLSFALGARGLGADGIWYDEWRTVLRAGGGPYGPLTPSGVLARAQELDLNQAPGYPLVMAGWGALVGWADVPARALSLLAGVLTIPFIYQLGRSLASRRAGLIAALLLGTSGMFIYYLHEMRTYTLLLALGSATLWAYWRVIESGRLRFWSGALLVLGPAGMMYLHYFGALLISGVAVYHLLFVAKNRLWWSVTGLVLLAGALFAPWVRFMFSAVASSSEETPLSNVFANLVALNLDVGFAFSNGWPWLLIALASGALLALARAPRSVALPLTMLIVSIGVQLVIMVQIDLPSRLRYLLVLWLPLSLLVGVALDHLARVRGLGPPTTILVLFWAAAGVVATGSTDFDAAIQDRGEYIIYRVGARWDELGDALDGEVSSTDSVVVSVSRDLWAVRGSLEYYLANLPTRFHYLNEVPRGDVAGGLSVMAEGASRVWLATDQLPEPNNRNPDALAYLSANYVTCDMDASLTHMDVTAYAVDEICCAPPKQPLVTYSPALSLANAVVSPTSEGVMAVTLSFDVGAEVPVNTYSVAVSLTDADGEIVVQRDVPLPERGYTCLTVTLEPPPDGQPTTVRAVVYNWASGERLSGTVSADGTTTDFPAVVALE